MKQYLVKWKKNKREYLWNYFALRAEDNLELLAALQQFIFEEELTCKPVVIYYEENNNIKSYDIDFCADYEQGILFYDRNDND